MFPAIDYLEWIEGRPAAAVHDLGSSDLRPVTGGGMIPKVLADRSAPEPETTLEAQIADRFDVTEAEVLVTPGATTAYAVSVAAALADGDRILVELPGYEPHVATPSGFDATVDRFRRTADDWELDPSRIEAALVEDTALVAATNRHNPTGALTDRARAEAAAVAARSHGARLLIDEVYGPYGEPRDRGFGGVTAAGVDGAVVIGSLTKFLGLGGVRIGWILADEPFIERARTVTRHLSAVADPSRALGRRAFAAGDDLAERARGVLARSHDRLAAFLRDRDDLSGRVFPGCPYALLFHETASGDTVSQAAWERDLLVIPGRFFDVDEGFRVSLGGAPAAMDTALSVLGETLEGLGRQD